MEIFHIYQGKLLVLKGLQGNLWRTLEQYLLQAGSDLLPDTETPV